MSSRRRNRGSRRSNQGGFPIALVLLGGTGLVLGFLIVVGIVTWLQGRPRAIAGVEEFPNQPRGHVQGPVDYAVVPPVGGEHYALWQNCGIYDEPIVTEHAVHSLEHGAVWITYQPDLPEDQVRELERLTQRGSYRLLSPFPGLESPIVASAWGLQLRVDSADDSRLRDFLQVYEQGPQTPEVGAACTGGVAQTASELQ